MVCTVQTNGVNKTILEKRETERDRESERKKERERGRETKRDRERDKERQGDRNVKGRTGGGETETDTENEEWLIGWKIYMDKDGDRENQIVRKRERASERER